MLLYYSLKNTKTQCGTEPTKYTLHSSKVYLTADVCPKYFNKLYHKKITSSFPQNDQSRHVSELRVVGGLCK